MISIKRIRIDPEGLILQNSRGMMNRMLLPSREIDELMAMDNAEKIAALKQRFPQVVDLYKDDMDVQLDCFSEKTSCLNRPLRIYYGIEPRCDLQCSFCGPRNFHNPLTPDFEKEEFLIDEIARSGSFQIQLTGGEVFYRGDDLIRILKKIEKKRLAVILATNGVWNCVKDKDRLIRDLKSFNNIIQVKISIEGTPDFHDAVRGEGSYEKAVDTLEKLSMNGLNPRISTTIFHSSCNKTQIDHLVDLAETYNAGFQPIPLRMVGRATSLSHEVPTLKELYEYTEYVSKIRAIKKLPITFNFDIFQPLRNVPKFDTQNPVSCGAPQWGIHITHLGDVYPCGFTQEINNGKTFQCGRIEKEGDLISIWQTNQLLKKIRTSGKSEKCKKCKDYGLGCWGGCWVMAWLHTKKIDGSDPYCFVESDYLN